ncbi:MAG TPA: S8 family serine peptidase, partial [Chitinophagaceae bacterium]|nr:S8 family serine peptidase [Chitinophagaceae bacterium]
MRFYPVPLMAVLLLLSFSLPAQQDSRYRLLLKSGTVIPDKNIDPETVSNFNRNALRSNGKASFVIQFERIPATEERNRLKQAGIELIDYLPDFCYTAIVGGSLDYTLLRQVNARAVMILKPEQKMQPELASGVFPSYAVKVAGTVDVWINFSPSFGFEEIKQALQADNFDLLSTSLKNYRIVEIRAAAGRLFTLASYPFVEYVQVAPGEDKPLSQFWTNWGKDAIRSNILGAPLSAGGKNLKGAGVTIGIGDDADPQIHIDFINRMIAKAAAPYNYHGTHVSGIAGGAGIRNELRTGMAPKSTLLSQVFSNVFTNAAAYTADHGMVITNNSYYSGYNQCDAFGYYDGYSRLLDQQAFLFPNLQHVFAAGNSGLFKCSPMPDSFRTVHAGYQSAKNVLTVANASPVGGIWRSSSRGPVRDGRLKPEIAAVGTFITATAPPPFDYYWENTGTSMASPAIAGGLALLYERFKQLNGNTNPKNGL